MREKIKADEASVVESISTRGRVLKASIPQESPPAPDTDPEQAEQVQAPDEPQPASPQTRRESPKRRRGQSGSYEELFLKRKELKARQSVYISQEVHGSIARLVHILALEGKDISVGNYIDNVLAEHLEIHKELIAEMCRRQLDKYL